MPTAAGDAASGKHHPKDRFQWDFVTPGIPDGAFAHAPGFSPTPMELRVMLLAHLRPQPDSLVWDVGGGTGAVALEIARLLPHGAVLALERDPGCPGSSGAQPAALPGQQLENRSGQGAG